ncbi:hypoxia up-regulated protein 1 [Rhincodon typus]|uniref:hypoxia up-regulated protein 1 n=1 Tax=Rhincodon typus TaxID=259920 RepID=UPI0009A44E34|nr:hypoxia up-regulated protein 1 [Rhincodon typus]XP_048471276.1 hypoxia up-regulated protein 1 [Rhincodon typus]XP_048471277.1 hypoxia up-regulated protein 1 [Rhincodon typus]
MDSKMGLSIWMICFSLTHLVMHTDSVAVMSVDLGSEWMKIAIVKPGVPMEIVLNKESRRKTPVAVALKENERLFGDSAVAMAAKNPKVVARYLQDLLGKRMENPQVELYRKRFPEHQLVAADQRGTVVFKFSDELYYSPEEILGMVLNYSRTLAQDFAEQPIKDLVITVPAYFNQAERRAVVHAAQMVGLKVLQLINDNTAVALNYGVFRRKDINATAQNVMFFDMGSSSTTATIVTYITTKTKDSGTQPQLQIRGTGFDRNLGGLEMELRLQDHLADLFNAQKKTPKDVRQHPRAMAKLWKEANRVKTVLSANIDHMAQIEGLLDDIDFKAKVTRQKFEELCSDLFERVADPVHQALKVAEMKMEDIDHVILVGGATRVPKVQEVLLKAVGKKELGKNINADEAASMGAVYQAAALSKAFKVKPFLIRDAAMYPIQVEFTRAIEEDGVKSIKHNKRVLFQRMSPYPQRKVITFNRYTDDFEFFVNYGDLNFLSESDLSIFGSLNLSTVRLSGVGSSFQKHSDSESKGIKAHFNMDESGILALDRVEAVFEKVQDGEPEEESTLTKLGNTISSLFGGGSSETDGKENLTESVQDEEEPTSKTEKDDQEELASAKEKEIPTEEKSSKSEEENKAEPNEEKGGQPESGEDTAKTETPETLDKKVEDVGKEEMKDPELNKTEEVKKPKGPKRMKISANVTVELEIQDLPDLSQEEMSKSQKKLQDLTDRDLQKHEHEKMANSLEAFIFETQDKLYQDEYQAVSTQDERDQISTKLSEVSNWLDEDGYAASTQELKAKLSELRKMCKELFFKVEERRKWPDRLAALDSMLNHSTIFLKGARLIPEADQIFTEVELNTLEKVITETTTWKNETVKEQNKLPSTEKPILLAKDIEAKLALLDREVKYLLNKAKFAKPKPRKEKNTTQDVKNTTTEDQNTTAADSENVIPPAKETGEGTEHVEEVKPGDAPPTVNKDKTTIENDEFEIPEADVLESNKGTAEGTAENDSDKHPPDEL